MKVNLLKDAIVEALSDRKWHSFLSLIPIAIEVVPFEMAGRYYRRTRPSNNKDDKAVVSSGDIVFQGRRRALTEALRDLTGKKDHGIRADRKIKTPFKSKSIIDAQGPRGDVNKREYRLRDDYVPPPKKEPTKIKEPKVKKVPADEALQWIDDMALDKGLKKIEKAVNKSAKKENILRQFNVIQQSVLVLRDMVNDTKDEHFLGAHVPSLPAEISLSEETKVVFSEPKSEDEKKTEAIPAEEVKPVPEDKTEAKPEEEPAKTKEELEADSNIWHTDRK